MNRNLTKFSLKGMLGVTVLGTVGLAICQPGVAVATPFEWELVDDNPFMDNPFIDERARMIAFANRAWVSNSSGLYSTRDGKSWAQHLDRNLENASLAIHDNHLYIAARNVLHRVSVTTDAPNGPDKYMIDEEVGPAPLRTSLVSHGGDLWGFSRLRVTSMYTPFPWGWILQDSMSSVGETARHLGEGEWEIISEDSTHSATGAVYLPFGGSLWALGGTNVATTTTYTESDRSGMVSDSSEHLADIRHTDDGITWVSEGPMPEIFVGNVRSAHLFGDTIYVPIGQTLYTSNNMLDWEVASENFMPDDAATGELLFLRNRAWFFEGIGTGGPTSVWRSGPLLDHVDHDFARDWNRWIFWNRFDEVEASATHDSANRRILFDIPQVNAKGYATFEGPHHEATAGDIQPADNGRHPIPTTTSDEHGDRHFRMEVAAEAAEGNPWFRLRSNAQRHETASEVKITTLGGEKAIFSPGRGIDTYTALISLPERADYFMPFVDLFPNDRTDHPGTLALEGIRFTEWIPPAPENLELIREYTFINQTDGFTPRTVDDLLPPVAQYNDDRGLVIRGTDSPGADGIVFGFWGNETDITISGGAVYKTTWKVGSNTPVGQDGEMPIVRVRINESLFRISPVLTIASQPRSRLPLGGTTEEYILWFQAPDILDGADLILSFDLLWTNNDPIRRPNHEVWLESVRVEKTNQIN